MIPSFFIAHGAPTLVIEQNGYTRFLHRLAGQLPRPRAVAVFSAHWEHEIQQVSGAADYETIYDFYGFPPGLYQIRYPAKGDGQIAGEVRDLFAEQGIRCDIDSTRGLDHGAWVVLKLLYPEADIPVVALSVNPALPPAEQYRIGQALGKLRRQNVLILGSGGTVHNLRRLDWDGTEAAEWAVRFDDWIKERLERWDLEELFDYEGKAPHGLEAVPRSEHFVPLLIAMGAADDSRSASLLYREFQYGSLSLSCWRFGN